MGPTPLILALALLVLRGGSDWKANMGDRDPFGAHVKRLREVRRLTQEELAARSGLAADTIRRLEHQEFSPSLRTLRKVCVGLQISIASMFNSFELDGSAPEELSRIHALLLGRSQAELVLVERVLSELFAGLDRWRNRGR